MAISNLDVENGSRFRNIWRDIPHTDANPEGRRERPARDLSDTLIFKNDFLTLSRHSLVSDLEAHPDPTRSLLLLNLNRSSSDKITFLVQSNSKIESGFNRRRLLVDVISVKAHSCLKSQNVPGSEARGFQSVMLAR